MANFCDKCGAALNQQTGQRPVCGAVYAPPIQPKPVHPPVREDVPPVVKPKKRHTALWIVLGAVAALLIAAAVVGVLEHFRIVNIPVVRKLEERMGIRPYAEEIYDENGVLQGYEARKDNGDYTYEYDARGRKIKVSWHEGTRSAMISMSTMPGDGG